MAEMAKATLETNPNVDWDAWVGNYGKVRDAIEATYPDQFASFNQRLFEPGGFPRPLGARERKWNTPTGKANFTVPKSLSAASRRSRTCFQLMTLRADGQFNTTIYTEEDRFRGVYKSRMVVLMNPNDIERAGLEAGRAVDAQDRRG